MDLLIYSQIKAEIVTFFFKRKKKQEKKEHCGFYERTKHKDTPQKLAFFLD